MSIGFTFGVAEGEGLPLQKAAEAAQQDERTRRRVRGTLRAGIADVKPEVCPDDGRYSAQVRKPEKTAHTHTHTAHTHGITC